MINLTDKERLEILGEAFMDELKVIREYLSDIPIIKQRLSNIEVRLDKIEYRLENVERLVIEHDKDLTIIKQKLALLPA